ncbi:guanylyl cyclase 1 isoform X2 [Nicotiana tabacum]|uniref:Protein GUCD1 isoform X2 n=2 Tax=Nicotiana tabacum TaxID=4097 RepID=A0A1S4A6A2_TOBAC|nr:PREDICTED: protein GUCD1-like isoform X2 [Nicotiana tabacum]XP_016472185.1 PREDICTED: protein GUCD1-like isoform X2 [Nicotiana tabacum]
MLSECCCVLLLSDIRSILATTQFSRTEEEYSQGSGRDRLSLVESFLCKRSVGTNKCHNTVLSCSYFCEVPHINQLHSWDCGLACVLMVLRTLGKDYDMQELEELCCTTSIWTVDLAYLLQKFSVNFSYFTVTLGANPSFCVETFYKEQLSNDLVRVDMLFQKARDTGINIECRSISSEEISSLILSGKFIAIALVDQYKLSHSWLEDIGISDFCNDNPGYTGHYVVICGYDADTDEFEIRDPASSRKHEKVTSRCLEGARKSFGTDEDLLLIRLQKEETESSPL